MRFHLRILAAAGAFLVASVYGVSIALLRRDRSLVARDYARLLAGLTRRALGLTVEVLDEDNLGVARPCVYVANHQSVVDVPILAGIYPAGTVVIGKRELKRIPFFGWLFMVTGNVLIDRTNNPSAVSRLKTAEEAIRERRVSVWVFPEGTRGGGTGELLPFKKGAFYMAIAAQVPIVPIVVSPVGELFDVATRTHRSGTVQVHVLEPVTTEGLSETDVDSLIERVHARMAVTLRELGTVPAGRTE